MPRLDPPSTCRHTHMQHVNRAVALNGRLHGHSATLPHTSRTEGMLGSHRTVGSASCAGTRTCRVRWVRAPSHPAVHLHRRWQAHAPRTPCLARGPPSCRHDHGAHRLGVDGADAYGQSHAMSYGYGCDCDCCCGSDCGCCHFESHVTTDCGFGFESGRRRSPRHRWRRRVCRCRRAPAPRWASPGMHVACH